MKRLGGEFWAEVPDSGQGSTYGLENTLRTNLLVFSPVFFFSGDQCSQVRRRTCLFGGMSYLDHQLIE